MGSVPNLRRYSLLAALAVLLAAALFFLFSPLDITGYRDQITSMIGARIGGNVEIGRMSLKVLPRPRITIDGMRIEVGDNFRLNSEHATIVISLESILKRELVVSSLEMAGPKVFVIRTGRGFGGGLGTGKGHPLFHKIVVKDGYVHLTDATVDKAVTHEISGVDISLSSDAAGFTYDVRGTLLPSTPFSIYGALSGGFKMPGLTGQVNVKALSTAHIWPYTRALLPDMELSASADIDADYTYKDGRLLLKGGVLYRDLKAAIPSIPARKIPPSSGSARIEADIDKSRKEITASELDIAFDGFSVRGGAGILLQEGERHLRLDLSSSPIPADSLNELIPPGLLPKSVRGMDITKGTITVKRLMVDGSPAELFAPEGYRSPGIVAAEVNLDGIDITGDGFRRKVSGLSGLITLENGVLSVDASMERYGNGTIKNLKGTLKGDSYRVEVVSRLDIAQILEDLRVIAADGLMRHLGKIKTKGAIDLTMEAKGSLKTRAVPSFKGRVLLREADVIHADYPVTLRLDVVEASLDNKRLVIHDARGEMGESSFGLKGTINNYTTEDAIFDIGFTGSIRRDCTAVVPEGHPLKDVSIDGVVSASGTIRGSKGRFSTDIDIEASGAGIVYPPFLKKREGFPATARLSMKTDGTDIYIQKARVLIGDSTLNVSGKIAEGRVDSLRIDTDDLRLSDIYSTVAPMEEDFRSGGSLAMHVRILRGKGLFPSVEGKASISNGRFVSDIFMEEVSRLDASLRFKGNSAEILLEGLQMGRSDISGIINVIDMESGIVDFNLVSSNLDMDSIRLERSKQILKGDYKLPRLTGGGKLTIAKGTIRGIGFESFQSIITMDKDSINISPVSFIKHGGRVVGNIKYYRRNVPTLFKARIRVFDVGLEPLLKELGAKKNILTDSTVNGTLEFAGKRWTTPFRKGIDGSVHLSSRNGKLWKFLLMSKIFSIVNIISLNDLLETGMPYELLEGDFTIKDGVISSENLHLDGNSMRMSAYGEINMANWTIDAKLGLHPFVTIDKVITKIPIAGWIIGGKEKSIINMYYEMKGPLKDPDVKLVPIKSLGEKILSILERTLETPLRAIEPITK